MPIKPENKKLYGPNWQQISRNIRFKRAKGKCENCGVMNGQRRLFSHSHSVVILATAHLDHNETNNRATNLKALCQECHLNHDRDDNLRRAKLTRWLRKFRNQPALFPFRKEHDVN